ncbi:unnamed protein product, partial [Brenthis ino]
MKPYPGIHNIGNPKRIFNEKLSRSRVIVENTFGVLCTKFRVFRKPFALCPEKVTLITLTCILLHNYLRKSKTSSQVYTPPGTMDIYDNNNMLVQSGSWRNEIDENGALRNLPRVARLSALGAIEVREEFTKYFCSKQVYYYHIITNADIEEEIKSKQAYPIVHFKNETCYDNCGLGRRDSIQSVEKITDDVDLGSGRSGNLRLEENTGRTSNEQCAGTEGVGITEGDGGYRVRWGNGRTRRYSIGGGSTERPGTNTGHMEG